MILMEAVAAIQPLLTDDQLIAVVNKLDLSAKELRQYLQPATMLRFASLAQSTDYLIGLTPEEIQSAFYEIERAEQHSRHYIGEQNCLYSVLWSAVFAIRELYPLMAADLEKHLAETAKCPNTTVVTCGV